MIGPIVGCVRCLSRFKLAIAMSRAAFVCARSSSTRIAMLVFLVFGATACSPIRVTVYDPHSQPKEKCSCVP